MGLLQEFSRWCAGVCASQRSLCSYRPRTYRQAVSAVSAWKAGGGRLAPGATLPSSERSA